MSQNMKPYATTPDKDKVEENIQNNNTPLCSILKKLGMTLLSVLLNGWLHFQAAVVFLALGLLY